MKNLILIYLALLVGNVSYAASISPGDLIFSDSFRNWYKFNPTTRERVQLPWEKAPIATTKIQFDIDGRLLLSNTSDGFYSLNPLTGKLKGVDNTFNPLYILAKSFVITEEGSIAYVFPGITGFLNRQIGGHGINGTNRRQDFLDIDRTPNGDYFVTNGNSNGIFKYSRLPNLEYSQLILSRSLEQPENLVSLSNGDIVVYDRSLQGLYQIDTSTGHTVGFTENNTFGHSFAEDMVVDHLDRVWLADGEKLFLYEEPFRVPTEIVDQAGTNSFLVDHLAIVPQNWSPSLIPEPSTALTGLLGCLLFFCMSSRALTRQPLRHGRTGHGS